MTLRAKQLLIFAVVVTLASMAAPMLAAAQTAPDWTRKAEIVGNVGHGRLASGDSEWASGVDLGVTASLRPLSGSLNGLGFEVRAAWLNDSGARNAQVSSDLSASLVAVDLAYYFLGRSRIQPYLLGGFSYVNADYTYRCVDCVFTPEPVTGRLVSRGVVESLESGSKSGFNFGGGVTIALRRYFSVRPEILLTDTTAGSGYNWGWMQLQVGLGMRF